MVGRGLFMSPHLPVSRNSGLAPGEFSDCNLTANEKHSYSRERSYKIGN